MAYDNNLVLQASTTQTASFNSVGLSLRQPASTTGTNIGGSPKDGPLKVRVRVTATSGTTPTSTFKIQHSDDNATWADLAYQLDPTFSATGITFIPFETDKPFVRLVSTIGGTTPSFTYAAEIGICRP